jgi:outer membrane protein assembly factor BamD
MRRPNLLILVGLVALASACRTGFDLKRYPTAESLFRESLHQLDRHKWSNAVAGFEKLTNDLTARDTLQVLSFYYLGRAHMGAGDYILAASAYQRLAESFPDDSLAPLSLFEAAQSYERMWKNPELDPQYGEQAMNAYQTLARSYPKSPYKGRADTALLRLEDRFAQKDFRTAEHYMGRRAYHSALLYYQDVVKQHPNTPTARKAYLRMVAAYRELEYADDAEDTCKILRERYPNDAEVRSACGSSRTASK